jgi:hypothetical protein
LLEWFSELFCELCLGCIAWGCSYEQNTTFFDEQCSSLLLYGKISLWFGSEPCTLLDW